LNWIGLDWIGLNSWRVEGGREEIGCPQKMNDQSNQQKRNAKIETGGRLWERIVRCDKNLPERWKEAIIVVLNLIILLLI
jgi:hypothetical protein